ncbi:Acid phosphatase [Globisporangium polare]
MARLSSAAAAAFVTFAAILLLSCSAPAAAALPILDDEQCAFERKSKSCEPTAFCAFQYRLGDLTPDQSCRVVKAKVAKVPQQLHLAYAGRDAGSGVTISWSTYTKVSDPQVWLGVTASTLKPMVPSTQAASVDVTSYYSDKSYSLYTYHVTLSGLTPNMQYFYKVGCSSCGVDGNEDTTSSVSAFTTAKPSTNTDAQAFEIFIYGDFGADVNAQQTTAFLTKNSSLSQQVDFVYHIGDISYADNDFLSLSSFAGFFYEETYNHWLNSLASLMRSVPYMVLVGNHEAECHSPQCLLSEKKQMALSNYSAYNARFKMPSSDTGGVKNMWYAFEHGPVHFTSISTESDYPGAPRNSFIHESRNGHFGDQLTWLEANLKAADANRAQVPWLIVGMHRPMYTLLECDKDGNPKGTARAIQLAFEELFIKYKVDVVVAGHVHAYERHFPIANSKKVAAGVSQDRKSYVNPQAPVYLVTGAAGNSEGHEHLHDKPRVEWVAATDTTHYGISSLKVTRKALSFKLLGTGDGVVYDEFEITKS